MELEIEGEIWIAEHSLCHGAHDRSEICYLRNVTLRCKKRMRRKKLRLSRVTLGAIT